MPHPRVSIVMPVFNAAPFLREAIKSMLEQSFDAFEFIIINDGSTDESQEIIRSFNDPRIRYVQNEYNKGIVYTLNLGIGLASTEYVARMDADDISLPERLLLQVNYLDEHPYVDVVACVVNLVDANGNSTGYWKEDREHMTESSIQEFLPLNNCIAHPSIMARTEMLKAFKYLESQKQAEDYDLWLRMIAGGKIIHKIEEPLLLHRIQPRSFTRQRQRNVFFKLAETKLRFAWNEARRGNWNSIVVKTGLNSFADYGKGYLKALKNGMDPK